MSGNSLLHLEKTDRRPFPYPCGENLSRTEKKAGKERKATRQEPQLFCRMPARSRHDPASFMQPRSFRICGQTGRKAAWDRHSSRLELSIVSPEFRIPEFTAQGYDGWPFYGANISAKIDKTSDCASWLIIPRFLTNRDLSTVLSWSRTTWPCLPLKEQLTLVG